MELNLQPLSTVCHVTQDAFLAGQRLVSFLVRDPAQPEIVRYDVSEPAAAGFAPAGVVVCRWVHLFKPRKPGDTSEKTLKLTAETLFLTLADPSAELTPENTRLVQFLALMLERKRLLKPRGRTADGLRTVVEHTKSKQLFEIPAGDLNPEFFIQVQAQLSVLVGEPKPPSVAGKPLSGGDEPPPPVSAT
ncbi:MAG: hypothetical protein JNN01_01535 [Opitutaceae bacterium]|nr:hypothetical protein [Opitutaceae bacterium]